MHLAQQSRWLCQQWVHNCGHMWSTTYLLTPLFFFFCLFRVAPRLGVIPEIQMPAYATAIATPDPSRICDLYHHSRQHWILNPLSRTRDWTRVLIDTTQVHYCWATTRPPLTLRLSSCHVSCSGVLPLPTASARKYRNQPPTPQSTR